jgi:hypothetical protein
VSGVSPFYNCTSLKKVILPLFVSSSASSTFQNCGKLELIDIDTINEELEGIRYLIIGNAEEVEV